MTRRSKGSLFASGGFASLLLALAAFPLQDALALGPGMKTPDVTASKWYFKDSSPSQAGQGGADVVIVFDAGDPSSFAFLRMLEALRDSLPASQLASVQAVARNTPAQMDEFFKANGPVRLPVAADSDGFSTYREFCDAEPVLPIAFVALPGGALAWSGHPAGVESVIKKIAEKTFDIDKQKRIAVMRTELQTALQGGFGEVVHKNADRILALDPGDMIAIQAKLFVFENQAKPREAKDFLLALKAKAPGDPEIRLLLLNYLVRAGDLDAFKAETALCYEDFKGNAAFLPKLCSFLMDNAPFGTLPLEIVLASAKANLDSLTPNASQEGRAFAYELFAKANYFSGSLSLAVEWQAKACELRKGGPYEVPAAQLLDYYRQARKTQVPAAN